MYWLCSNEVMEGVPHFTLGAVEVKWCSWWLLWMVEGLMFVWFEGLKFAGLF